MTCVIRNSLSIDGHKRLKSDWGQRQLKRMARTGEVKLVPSVYARQICWGLAEPEAP